MRKMFLVTYLTRNERFLRFLLNMYIYFCGIILVTITENNLKKNNYEQNLYIFNSVTFVFNK